MKRILIFSLVALICTSCRYKTAALNINGNTVVSTSIPVIKDDPNGHLRNYLAREMATTGSLYYRDSGAKYYLKVEIKKDIDSKISFMWDRDPVTNQNLRVYYPSEGMKELIAKVELLEVGSDKVVVGPLFIRDTVDYDFVNPTVPDSVSFQEALAGEESILQYSLGQLDSEEGAKAEAYHPAYKRLAKKIVASLLKSSRRVNK